MASSSSFVLLLNALMASSLLHILFASSALGDGTITCESLDKTNCAYAVSSTGTRCVLEKRITRGRLEEYTCRSSKIEAGGGASDLIETDECVKACGVERDTLGISSDFLSDAHFTKKLCSDACYKGCPNIVDLYFNLAAGEGVFLPELCEWHKASARRSMVERSLTSTSLASSPESSFSTKLLAFAPTSESLDLAAVSPAPM